MFWNKMVPELTVSRFEVSFSFYVDILGFEVVHQRENPKFAYLDMNDAQLMIEEYHTSGWNVAELKVPYGRGINFQIEVEDVDNIFSSVKKNEIKIYRSVTESWYEVAGGKKQAKRNFLFKILTDIC